MFGGLKKGWRWTFGYKIDPPPRGRVNEPDYAARWEKAGRPNSWPRPGGKHREPSHLLGLFRVRKGSTAGVLPAKGEPIPALKPNRIFRSTRVHPETGVLGTWVKPYSADPVTGLEEIHEDQSPSKGVVVKEI